MSEAVEKSYDLMFTDLYRELQAAHPHPFDWLHLMRKPPWWRFRARAAYNHQTRIFAAFGLSLNDDMAAAFRCSPYQRYDEDAGGSFVRRLRYTFQYQTGVPYNER